ncbi:MAG: hypothetical protein PUB28_08740 [Roseburia sp.]|nr:hypothetical protein [Roseburia sp.]
MNKEKYSDPTAEEAIGHVMNEEKKNEDTRIYIVIKIFKLVLQLAGMEMEERIKIRDKRTGKIWI